jgi:outer membrane protein OmpA-like peptidoglycan-associated protein
MSRQNPWLFEVPLVQTTSYHVNLESETLLENDWEISGSNAYNFSLPEEEWEASQTKRPVNRTRQTVGQQFRSVRRATPIPQEKSSTPRRQQRYAPGMRRWTDSPSYRHRQVVQHVANQALVNNCPSDDLKPRMVYGWNRYRTNVKDLPDSQRDVVKQVGDTIIRSFEPGCRKILKVHIYGHADYDTPRNLQREQEKSEERAKAVLTWLQGYVGGNIAAQIDWSETKGLGASNLQTPPTTEENRKKNRRVEIVLTISSPSPPLPPPPPPPLPPPPKKEACDSEGRKFLMAGLWNRETTLRVTGGQSMRFFLKNLNLLGTTITIREADGQSKSRIIPPMGSTDLVFSSFGNEPRGWAFTISTNSDAFLVSWSLCSTWVSGDPPNP